MKFPSEVSRSIQAAGLAVMLALGIGCNKQASEQPPPPTDQQIASAVQAKIGSESALNGQNIQVGVQGAVVTLSGTANDEASRALASNDAGSVSGVKTVLNNLTVQPPAQAAAAPAPVAPPPPPAESAREKQDRLMKERAAKQREAKLAQRRAQAEEQAPPVPPAPQPVPERVQTVAPPPPPAPPKPVLKTVTIPAGTVVPVRITEGLDSSSAQPNQTFHGTVSSDLIVDGMVAVPQGSTVVGRVIDAKDAAHFKGSSLLSIELTQLTAHGRQIALVTDPYSKQGAGRGKNTAAKVGGGAALGAIIGALAGGGKGAAIGAAAGGGLGAGANTVTRGEQVQIKPETLVNFKLQSPVNVTTSRAVGAPRSFSDNSPQLQQRPQ